MIGCKKQKNYSRNTWLNRRRDYFVTDMFKKFYHSSIFFLQIYREHIETGRVSYADIEKLVGTENKKGCLWRLKDDCHLLWRNGGYVFKVDDPLLDWIIGSIFHEAMKLKENIYLLEYYAPPTNGTEEGSNQEIRKFCGLECRRFMEKIFHEPAKQLENIGILFGRASFIMRNNLPLYSDNFLLLRYFIENPNVVVELWSETLDEIFKDMFNGAPEKGYCFAGLSYFEGNWYEKSLGAFQEAMRVNERCKEADLWTRQLKALLLSKKQEKQQGKIPLTQLL